MREFAPPRQTRFAERTGESVESRLRMTEFDLDQHDRVFEMILAKQDANNKILLGLLIAITSAAVVGVLNLVFGWVPATPPAWIG